MLKGEGKEVSIAFERRRAIRTRETLRKDNPDSAMEVCWIPCPLLKYFTVEDREAKAVLVTLAIGVYLC